MYTINLSYLDDITGGDAEVMTEMIELVISETPKHLDNMKRLADQKSWKEAGSEAHKLKPMFLYVGLNELHEICKDIEEFSNQPEKTTAIPSLAERLQNGFLSITDDLQKVAKNYNSTI